MKDWKNRLNGIKIKGYNPNKIRYEEMKASVVVLGRGLAGLSAATELSGEDNFKFVQHDITQPILFDEHGFSL